MRGHLLEPKRMIPFSMDKLSFGREAAVQSLVVTGSSRRDFIVMSALSATPLSLIPFLHSSSKSALY